jgi:hypothetical protein
MDKQRTDLQNKAMHKLFTMLSDQLNEAGLDMKKVLKPEIDIPWSSKNVKEYLWRPVQEAMLGKKSTTELTTKEIDQIYEVLCRHLGQKLGITMPDFPSYDQQNFLNTYK